MASAGMPLLVWAGSWRVALTVEWRSRTFLKFAFSSVVICVCVCDSTRINCFLLSVFHVPPSSLSPQPCIPTCLPSLQMFFFSKLAATAERPPPSPAFCTMEKYFVGDLIGEGQFGRVSEATMRSTGATVAIKQIRVPRLTEGLPHPVARELLITPRLRCAFIVRAYEVFPSGSSMVLVMERCATDLAAVLRDRCVSNPLPVREGQRYFRMLLTALAYIHREHILHRDVKPSNCFLTSSGVLKLGDFGLSRIEDDDMTHEVASRWYRAPELLLGQRHYGAEIDMWSAGCVLGEVLRGYGGAFFPGDGDINQLSQVFDALGTPTMEDYPEVCRLPDWERVCFQPRTGYGVGALVPLAPAEAVDLLESLLCLNPQRRLTAAQALRHPFMCQCSP